MAGDSVLRAFYQDRGSMPGMMGLGSGARNADQPEGAALATLRVAGEPVASLRAVPAQQGLGDLRSAAVAARRQIVLAAGTGMGMGGGMMRFTINGREFNAARTDTTVAAGDLEEWMLTNTSPMDHPFHLHVWPMQIIEENGQGTNTPIWQDVVRDFHGRSVYHCQILDHEDLGMMSAIEVR